MLKRHPFLFRCLQIFVSLWTLLIVGFGVPFANPAMAQVSEQLPPPPQGGGFPVLVGGDIGRAVGGAMTFILNQLLQSAVIALLNAAQIFLGQLAYDAATTIASAGQGQQSVFEKRGWGKYFEDVAGAAAGEFIGSLSSEFFDKNGLGYDLCRPTDPRQLLRMQLSLGAFFPNLQQGGGNGAFQRPRPRCDLKQITENWNTLAATMSQTDVFQNVQFSLNTNTSDIGGAINIFGRNIYSISGNIENAIRTRTEGQGFKNVTNVLSGNVKTPSQVVKAETEHQLIQNPAMGQWQVTGAVFTNAFRIGLPQLFTYTASVFANTLMSKLMKRIFDRGIDSTNLSLPLNADAVSKPSKTDTRNAFIDLKTTKLQTIRDFEVVSEMMGCPTGPKGTWNCVLDQALGRALQEQNETGGVTIKKAIEGDLLHANWRLIPDTDARMNTDTDCYSKAYCSGNLRKMRIVRILPVGFEFAANSDENKARCSTASGCVTLKEVVDGFGNCNASGNRDAAHPWCKVIDPNWVLSSIPQQCAASGYGEALISDAYGRRKDECADVQTCLKRNDQGECIGGYGYCMAEKTAYRFGADECLPREASCRNYIDSSGVSVSFLRNTLDYGRCTADNVGCLWYATERDPAGDSSTNWIGTTTTGNKMYFDKTFQACAASDEGCTTLRQVALGQPSLNLVANPSFEQVATDIPTNNLIGWTSENAGFVYARPTVLDGQAAQFDSQAYPTNASILKQKIRIVGGRSYVFSVYVRKLDVFNAHTAAATITQYKSATTTAAADQYTSGQLNSSFFSADTCSVSGSALSINGMDAIEGGDWTRFSCVFTAQADAKSAEVKLSGTNSLMDGAEVEEGEAPTDFVNGLNQSLAVVNMKVAPDEFNCAQNSTSTFCQKFAQVCRQTEAGCDAYTDTVNGGSPIPAIVSANDLCPNECVGYAEYRKEPSAFDLVADVDPRFNDASDNAPSYFIPSTAESCKQEEVGCEAFTNIEAVTGGGESTSYFSYARACELPSTDDTQTYYTWEGSDSTGYQLHTWSLKKTTRAKPGEAGPEVLALAPGADRFSIPAGPRILLKRAPGQNFFKEPASCNERSWRGADGNQIDADCRQFYDAQGNIFYRFYSQTIVSTDQCKRYRLNNSNTDDCTKTGGEYDSVTRECVYRVAASESVTCSESASKCRAFTGAGAGGQVNVLHTDFRSGTRDPFTQGNLSNESLLVGDSSLRLDNVSAPGVTTLTTDATFDSEATGLYRLDFWAKAPTGNVTAQILTANGAPGAGSPARLVGQVTLQSDWQRFTVGLFPGYAGATSTKLILSMPVSGSSIVYLDEVNVTKMQNTVYVRLNSWNTPAICDQNFAGAAQPQAMLGCSAYRNRTNQTLNVRQFSRLCRQEAVGCSAFVDTRNSAQTTAQTFNLTDTPAVPGYQATTTITAPADRFLYLIDDPSKRCNETAASCRAFGKPVLSANLNTVERFETVYYKDDVTKYADGLCKASEVFCSEYSGPGGAKEYFRNPQNHVCEYREGVQTPGGQFSGWFIKGTDTGCYPDLIEAGANFGIRRRGDDGYQGWVGTCEQNAGECTEFRDPNQKSALYSAGQPYYFIQNDKIDTATCAGNTDPSNGCILLRDTSNSRLTYSTQATYQRYTKSGLQPTAPVDCDANPSNPDCQQTIGGVATTTRNDANILLKVKIDRDCSQWLGCTSAETVLDSSTGKYKDICSNLALCDQSTGQQGDIFCGNYVNRTSTSTEPILTQGAYFDVGRYVSRQTGLGQKDYSGYSIPNNFQVSDLKNIRAVVNAFPGNRDIQSRFANEYRLSAAVPLLVAGQPSNPDRAIGLATDAADAAARLPRLASSVSDVARRFSTLNLCQHIGTGRIGFFVPSEVNNAALTALCYLPVSSDPGSDPVNAYNFQNLAQRFTAADPSLDAYLMRAYPSPECRSYPEQDSPYAAYQVTEWDQSSTPPKAVTKTAGLQGANTCEFGEDCLCTYKRVDYSTAGITKFYSPYSQNVPPGICQGGPRDGQTCIPSTIFDSTQASAVSQDCGPAEAGGRCVAISKSTIVTGLFGECLERDITRNIGANIQSSPCLTWNPTPILFGDKDPYHYVPTAAYLPPENAGQYYCTSLAKTPKTVTITEDKLLNSAGTGHGADLYNASLRENVPTIVGTANRLSFIDDCATSDKDCSSWDRAKIPEAIYRGFDRVSMIVNGGPKTHQNTPTGDQCRLADNHEREGNDFGWDYDTLRLVGTGRSANESYTEAFFQIDSKEFAKTLLSVDNPPSDQVYQALQDTNIGYFNFTPVESKSGVGHLACGYQADWVDGLGDVNYDDKDSLKQADQEWRSKFFENFKTQLSRTQEKLLAEDNGEGRPFTVPCSWSSNEERLRYGASSSTPDADRTCYLKYWELNYRTDQAPDTQQPFFSLQPDSAGRITTSLSALRQYPRTARCTAQRPYFSIRAVFQTDTTGKPARDTLNKNNLSGPWRFVGFWVATCGGTIDNDLRFIYFKVTAKSASVCTELAEVRSKYSNQDAAFTDRVWRDSGYTIPGTGISYGTKFSPFSSALNTKPAGIDPLFQNGGERVTGNNRQSSFIASGVETYFRDLPYPKDKWAYVSNIFARIYRVYRYYDQPVNRNDLACVGGTNMGARCQTGEFVPPTSWPPDMQARFATFNPTCSIHGICDPSLVTGDELQNTSVCNSTSGINAGLRCVTTGLSPTIASQLHFTAGGTPDVCHLGPLASDPGSGQWAPQFADCVVASDARYPSGAPSNPAGVPNVGRCETTRNADGSFKTFRQGRLCPLPVVNGTGVSGPSVGCPLLVKGTCDTGTGRCRKTSLPGGAIASSYGEQHGVCKTDADCTFDESNFWMVPNQDASGMDWNHGLPILTPRSVAVKQNSFNMDADNSGDPSVISTARDNWTACKDRHFRYRNTADSAELDLATRPGGAEEYCAGYVSTNGGVYNEETNSGYVMTRNPDGSYDRSGNKAITSRGEISRAPGSTTYIGNPGFMEEIRNRMILTYFVGPFAWIGFNGTPDTRIALARCENLNNLYSGPNAIGSAGRCRGGIYAGRICLTPAPGNGTFGCTVDAQMETVNRPDGTSYRAPRTGTDGGNLCASVSDGRCQGPAGDNPDTDTNICTHGVGYYPKPAICPNPNDEYCGLISYNRLDSAGSLNSNAVANLPTDVTMGHYSPWFLGFRDNPVGSYNYVGYYTPAPPRVAAPDIRNCPTPGQCQIQKLDMFSFDGASEGINAVAGGQHKASMRFYAWAAHNQMPLRRIVIDWGDGQSQDLEDIKTKNKKPFCGVQKECWDPAKGHSGLTCQADTDCPAGSGTCAQVGFCETQPNKTCAVNSECDQIVGGRVQAGRCVVRNFFGNSPEACETNYFDFNHQYTCNGQGSLPACRTGAQGYCSRKTEQACTTNADCAAGDTCLKDLVAPPNGCWDASASACRFTPRLFLQDNWGWCTGECRQFAGAGGLTDDNPSGSTSGVSKVIHAYGGCYSGTINGLEEAGIENQKVRLNATEAGGNTLLHRLNECSTTRSYINPGGTPNLPFIRPWIVYPGSLQLRAR